MDPRTAELSRRLAASRLDLENAVTAVPPAERGLPPGEGRWSVAQVLEHIAIVEASLTRAIEGLVEQAPARPDAAHFDAAAFSSPLDMPTVVDRSNRRTASPASQPTGLDADAALRRLGETRNALLSVLERADGRALDQVTRPHPVLGAIDAYQWISFVASHEARHAAQIREIGEQLVRGGA
jgi:hypothetical protein